MAVGQRCSRRPCSPEASCFRDLSEPSERQQDALWGCGIHLTAWLLC